MVASAGSGKSRVCGRDGDRGSCGGEQGVKKGPWMAAEDAVLVEYVRNHGEGNWNAVQRNCGLKRCGKSCRLRWANHLRPNLKKGGFSPEEERLIIELHAKIGNKWARMASQLPGRTDNEIKNYWNTRVKRLQRANLPIYPDDINSQQQQTIPNTSPPPPSLSSLSKFSPPLSLFRPFNFLPNPNPQFKPFHHNQINNNFGLPLPSPVFPFSSSLMPLTSSVFPNQFKSGDFDMNPLGVLVPRVKTELPSIQSPGNSVTPASSGSICGGDLVIETSEVGNSGLLEDLLVESKAMLQAEKLKEEISSSAHSSIGMKEKDPLEEMNYPIDDDLSSLLNNFPMTMHVPDWYDASATSSHGEPLKMEGNLGINISVDNLPPPVACHWNNMPTIH